MNLPVQLAILLLAFLIGSIPFGLLIAHLFQVKNLTTEGSGNIGATNVSRVVGFWPAGFLTFLLDVLKGVVPVTLVSSTGLPSALANLLGAGVDTGFNSTPLLIWSTGLFAVLGHCFSPWLHFRGGKGVATGFGVMLVLSPVSAVFGILGFIYCFLTTRIGSLSSLTGMTVASVVYLVLNPVAIHLWAGAAIIYVVLIRHETNLDSLLASRESKFN